MKNTTLLFTLFLSIITTALFGQCETWAGHAQEDYLTGQHSVYRGFVKNNNLTAAFDPWKEVYEAAPAADGKRDFHYTDGIKIYKDILANETDEAKKKEHIATILRLYDEAIECYQTRAITIKKNTDEAYAAKIADLYSRKSYDMYYEFRSPYNETMESLAYAFEIGGLQSPYTVIVPYANITVYQFLKEQIDAETARQAHDEMIKLADANIEGEHQYADYYKQAKEAALAEFKKIEYQIFDCEYFKNEWMPDYEDNADDALFAKDLYNKLRARGCDGDNDPFLQKLKTQYETYAAQVNAQRQAEFEANNPGILARKAYEAGDFDGAVAKYRTAIEGESDGAKQAKYHFSIASILFRKQNKYSAARSEALKAAEKDPSWGRPYVLIGDIYSKAARGCGDSWNQSLAILAAYDKWSYAKSKNLNSSISSDVDSKLSRYRQYFPTKDEGFMRGAKPNSKAKVGCWIGETVTVRYR
ncbi:MAG: hypothetical protein AAFQ02_07005 [Bacteroidota bacterium]